MSTPPAGDLYGHSVSYLPSSTKLPAYIGNSFWDANATPPYADYGESMTCTWARQALQELAIRTGRTAHYSCMSGIYRDGLGILGFLKLVQDTVKEFAPHQIYMTVDPELLLSNNTESANLTAYFQGPEAFVRVWANRPVNEFVVEVVAMAQAPLEAVAKVLAPWLTQDEKQGAVYAMMAGSNGISFRVLGNAGESLVRENYSDDVLKDYDRIKVEIQADKPHGRLSVLHGPPGCGKTYLVRGLLQECPKSLFILVNANQINVLAGPDGLPAMLRMRDSHPENKLTLIIEDADECLSPRAADNMSSISTILNMGDGIVGAAMDLRVIATTNAEKQELDTAVMRPGRLNVMTGVKHLDKHASVKILSRLTEQQVTDEEWESLMDERRSSLSKPGSATIAELYQIAFDKEWRSAVERKGAGRVGFGA